MPRSPRNYLDTTFFHVITQGIDKINIFSNHDDIIYYISLLYKIKEEHDIKIIAYCIMSNHTHMLIETGKVENLSKYMQRINIKYGQYYNAKYNRVGYVFRNRFKAEGIYTEEYLYNCIDYIYNNPVKAKICDFPWEYPYSNYKKINYTLSKNSYVFLEEDDDIQLVCKKIIQEFLDENKTSIEKIKNNRNKLKDLITILKKQNNISLRLISDTLEIGRETIRKLYNSK